MPTRQVSISEENGSKAPARRPQQNWDWAVGAVVFAVVLGVGLKAFPVSRGDAPPPPVAPAPAAPAADNSRAATPPQLAAEIAGLEARVKANPDNITLKLQLGDAYLTTPAGVARALQVSQEVLDKRPGNAHALAQQSVVRGVMGMRQQAFDLADQATRSEPESDVAWFARGQAAASLGRKAAIDESVARLQAINPDAADELRAALKGRPAPAE